MGLYDLSLAERFGYLDGQAEGIRSGARLYLTGASFWEVDWQQAITYFEQVIQAYPSLFDKASGMTADERWRKATLGYADQLDAAGSVCKAEKLYQSIVDLGKNPEVKPTLEAAKQDCEGKNTPTPTEGPTATATAVAGETATPVPTSEGPTNTPAPTSAGATNTPEPTKTPEAKPTDTPQPPTNTPEPPTNTPEPPTKTSVPPEQPTPAS